MGNVAENGYAKFNFDRLRIDKALEFWNVDNNNKTQERRSLKTTIVAIADSGSTRVR